MVKIRGIIFDMDGVLVDAKDWHYISLNKALEIFGYTISRLDHEKTFDGLPTRKKLEIISEKENLPNDLHKFINRLKQKFTMQMVYNLCKPNFIHEYALSNLKNDGYLLGLASNSIKDTIKIMMEKTSLIDYFDILTSAEDVQRPKPDPEIYKYSATKLGIPTKNCLVVEDNENGINAAKIAGCNVMVVNDVSEVNYKNIKEFISVIEKK